jgi:hypothetical protein
VRRRRGGRGSRRRVLNIEDVDHQDQSRSVVLRPDTPLETEWKPDLLGGAMAPDSWQLLYRDGEQWKPLENASSYGIERDRFNRVTFTPMTTGALRLEVQSQQGFSAGILEWRVEAENCCA